MAALRHWRRGLATGTSLLGLTVTSGLVALAHHFVEEFSRPHMILDESVFLWHVPQPLSDPPLALQRPLLFSAKDGTLLSGDFWAQSEQAPTMVLCHGYRASRAHLHSVATVSYAWGYNVLCFDFRGHGDSDSVMTSGGNAEVRDLEAALQVAARQPETLPGQIVLHGFSMGAAVALMTPLHPDVAAIVADSPYAHSDDILQRMIVYRVTQELSVHLPMLHIYPQVYTVVAWSTILLSALLFRLRFGIPMVAHATANFKRWHLRRKQTLQSLEQNDIPVLLIHAKGDPLIPFSHALQIVAEAEARRVPLETYFVENDVHCGAYGYDPLRYYQVLHQFLTRALGPALPEKERHFRSEDLPTALPPGNRSQS